MTGSSYAGNSESKSVKIFSGLGHLSLGDGHFPDKQVTGGSLLRICKISSRLD